MAREREGVRSRCKSPGEPAGPGAAPAALGAARARAHRELRGVKGGLTRAPRRDLGRQFSVRRLPAVVVLKPGGDVLTSDATDEIQRLGPACFANWQEAAELLDRSFLQPEDLDEPARRSITEPLRRRKYRVDRDGGRGRGRSSHDSGDPQGMQVQGQSPGGPQGNPAAGAGLW